MLSFPLGLDVNGDGAILNVFVQCVFQAIANDVGFPDAQRSRNDQVEIDKDDPTRASRSQIMSALPFKADIR